MLPKTIKAIIFDLDQTLYPPGSGLEMDLIDNIYEYMAEVYQLPIAEAKKVSDNFYYTYNNTMKGYMMYSEKFGHKPDCKRYHAGVISHFDYSKYLEPDRVLIDFFDQLSRTNIRRFILTNSGKLHAINVLWNLGLNIQDFEGVFSADDFNGLHCKPDPEVYEFLLNKVGKGINPGNVLFLDDNLKNIHAAKKVGFFSIWLSHGKKLDQATVMVADGSTGSGGGSTKVVSWSESGMLGPDLTVSDIEEFVKVFSEGSGTGGGAACGVGCGVD